MVKPCILTIICPGIRLRRYNNCTVVRRVDTGTGSCDAAIAGSWDDDRTRGQWGRGRVHSNWPRADNIFLQLLRLKVGGI